MLATVHPTLNDHEYNMRPTCVIHAVWRHFILVPSTSFSQVLWSVLWLCHQFVTDVTAWLINPNPSCSKNRKRTEKKTKNKLQKRENKNRVHRQRSWHYWTLCLVVAITLSLQLLIRPFSEIATMWLVGGTTYKLRPRSFWQVCITKLIAGVSILCACLSQLHRLSPSSANYA